MGGDRRYGSMPPQTPAPVARVLQHLGWRHATRGRRLALWRELRRRGARRELVRWARPFGRDVAKAWNMCPRGAWAIETAARAGVERTLVARAVRDCIQHAETHRLFVTPATRRDLDEATRAWLEGLIATDGWVSSVEAYLLEAVDSDPEVRETRRRVEQAHRWGDRAGMVTASNAYDETYLAARRRFASVVSARIPADTVVTALQGLKRHPYR